MSRLLLALALLVCASAALGADPKPLWTIDAKADLKKQVQIRWVGFTPDGKSLIARADPDGLELVGVWDTGTRAFRCRTESSAFVGMWLHSTHDAVLPDGRVLLRGYSAIEMTTEKGTKRSALPSLFRDKVAYGVWHCPASKQVVWAFGAGDETEDFDKTTFCIVPVDATAEKLRDKSVPRVDLNTRVGTLAVSADGSRVAFGVREDDTQQLSLRALTVGEKPVLTEVARATALRRGPIRSIQFAPNSKTLATGNEDSSVFLWDVEKAGKDWKPRAEIACAKFGVHTQVFNPDGRTLYALTFDRPGSPNLFVIDVATGKLVAKHALGGQLMCAAFTADGKALVIGDFGGRIAAWDAEALRKP
jgi:hypothetical protein